MSFHEIIFWRDIIIKPLNYILQLITKFYKIFIYFYLTSNNFVNAKFLSRYIARKLKQKYPVKELLKPIRKELTLLMCLCSRVKSSYFLLKFKKYYNNKIYINFKKKNYIILLYQAIHLFNNFIKNNFILEKNYLFLDIINYTIYIQNYLNGNNNNLLIKKSFSYLSNILIYYCLFEKSFFLNVSKNLVFFKLQKNYILNFYEPFDNLFN
jgi:hypothetical protein